MPIPATDRWKRRVIRIGQPGSADILGVLNGGLFLGIECKRPGNEPTDLQREWIRQVRDQGGVVMVIHSIDELEAEFKTLPCGAKK